MQLMAFFDENDGGLEAGSGELFASGMKGRSMLWCCCSARHSDALLVSSLVGTNNAAADSASSPCACISVEVSQCRLSAIH